LRAALWLIAGATAACTTPEERDRNTIARYLRQLPSCERGQPARTVDELTADAGSVRVRGLLTRGDVVCTWLAFERATVQNSGACSGRWMLTTGERAGTKAKDRIALRDRGGQPMDWLVVASSMPTIDRDIRPVPAVVTGVPRKRTADKLCTASHAFGGDDNPLELVVERLCVER
jgi:hypothetical protein